MARSGEGCVGACGLAPAARSNARPPQASAAAHLAGRHDRQDIARTIMRLAVTGRLVEAKGRFTLPAEDETPVATG
jgi:hypothetical protein